ncbi:MAG: hypothetical protein ACWGO1_02460 [Anaerolineales bacterium]
MVEKNEIMAAAENLDMSQGTEAIKEIMDNFVETASVEAVYGKPIKSGDVTIIPTAEVMCGMGFGMGAGFGMGPTGDNQWSKAGKAAAESEQKAEGEEPTVGGGAGSGGGGGGYTFSRPVALIISTPDGVRVEPVFDRTKILLAALTTAGFMVGMMSRMLKGTR